MNNSSKIAVLFLFFGNFSLYTMQTMKKSKLPYVASFLGIGYMAQQYLEDNKRYGSYNEFLHKEMKPNNDGSAFQRYEFQGNDNNTTLVLKTDVKVTKKYFEPALTGEDIVTVEHIPVLYEGVKSLSQDDDQQNYEAQMDSNSSLSFVKYQVQELPGQACECDVAFIKTKRKQRGKGFGSLLLRSVEDDARRGGCEAITLNAIIGKEKFYKDRGFKEVDPDTGFMEKKLKRLK